ncbi:MAG: hypothetical protein QM758_08215 [Armatimonas sp.]
MNDIKRRVFLKQGGLALASVGLVPAFGPAFLTRAAYGPDHSRRKEEDPYLYLPAWGYGWSFHGNAAR